MGRCRIPTVLVARSALLREGVARFLEGTDLRIDQSVATVEELRTESLRRHEAPLLVIECGDQIDFSVGEIERFKLHHPHGRVAVLGGDCSGESLISLFEVGTNVLLDKSTSKEIFLRALELVALGETLLPRELLAYMRPGNPQGVNRPVKSRISASRQISRSVQRKARSRACRRCRRANEAFFFASSRAHPTRSSREGSALPNPP